MVGFQAMTKDKQLKSLMVTPYSVINLHCGGFPSFLMQISIFNITVYFKDLSLLMPSPPPSEKIEIMYFIYPQLSCALKF